MDDFDVGPPPTDEQRRLLCEMMYRAFIEMRILGWGGKSEQAADLADAFHNLPIVMYRSDFSWSFFRHFLDTYQRKYPRNAGSLNDYLAMLEKIQTAA
jgi:hypothetical protein